MSTYRVQYVTSASTIVTVEADSPEEARTLADEEFSAPYVCAQCAGLGPSEGNSGIELSDVWEQDESDGGVWLA